MSEKRKKVSVSLGDAEAYVRARRDERELFGKLEGKELDNHDVSGNEKLAREQVQQADRDRQTEQQQGEQRRQQEQMKETVERSTAQQTEQQQAQREQQEEELER